MYSKSKKVDFIKNIVLTGFMMAGKSKIGRTLAQIAGYMFVDTDDLIVQDEKRDINSIFEKDGEEYFRNVESKIIREVSERKGCVVSTGGGAVLKKENIDNLRRNGVVVNLKITPEVIKSRIESERETRPVIKDLDIDGVLKKLESRNPFYENCDYSIIVSDDKTPEEHAQMIMGILKGNGEI